MSRAAKSKANFQKASSSATGLSESIRSGDSAWSWANNEGTLGPLSAAVAAMKAATTPFIRDFMAMDLQQLRKELNCECSFVLVQAGPFKQ
eukprot:8851942-Alexandrium_andersonii.AAC.1